MTYYLVFDNPQHWLTPIVACIDTSKFVIKHTDYELSIMLQSELDEFAIWLYSLFKPSPIFPEWYEKQKRIGRIYTDTRIRQGLCVLKPKQK